MNKSFANHKLTDWAIDMFFNYIGGEYFSYPKDEQKKKEYDDLIMDLIDMDYNQNKSKQAYKKARRYVIENFCSALSLEFDCSYGYGQKVVVGAFGLTHLQVINNELISKVFEYNSDFNCCDIALNNDEIKIS